MGRSERKRKTDCVKFYKFGYPEKKRESLKSASCSERISTSMVDVCLLSSLGTLHTIVYVWLEQKKVTKVCVENKHPAPPPCVSKMAVIFYRLNSEEIRFFAPKDCNLLLIQIIFPPENKSSSIGIQKYRTNQLEYILLIKH